MATPDYPAFRRVLDGLIEDEFDMHPVCIERAGMPDVYLLSERLLSTLIRKAQEHDEITGPQTGEEAEELSRLRAALRRQT